MNILCICTGNICRSPMLEYLLRNAFEKSGRSDCTVTSAGTATQTGSPPSLHAVTAMDEIGIDISAHRSRQITTEIVRENDAFVVLTPAHGVTLAFQYGADPQKIITPGGGIPDPYGQDLDTYRRCRDDMIAALPQLIRDLEKLA